MIEYKCFICGKLSYSAHNVKIAKEVYDRKEGVNTISFNSVQYVCNDCWKVVGPMMEVQDHLTMAQKIIGRGRI